jgi:hypothetical protein
MINQNNISLSVLERNPGLMNTIPNGGNCNNRRNKSSPKNALSHHSVPKNVSHHSVPKNNASKKEKVKPGVKAYRIVDFPKPGDKFGRYQGKEPAKAAKKAFTKLARLSKLNNSNQKFIVFVIEEIGVKGRDQEKKQHKYMGQRVKLDKPKVVKIGDKEITYKYQNIVNVYDGSA